MKTNQIIFLYLFVSSILSGKNFQSNSSKPSDKQKNQIQNKIIPGFSKASQKQTREDQKFGEYPKLLPEQFLESILEEDQKINLKFSLQQNQKFWRKLTQVFTNNSLILNKTRISPVAQNMILFINQSYSTLEYLKIKNQQNLLLNKYTSEVLDSYLNLIKDALFVKKNFKYVSVVAPQTGYRYDIRKKNQFQFDMKVYRQFLDRLIPDLVTKLGTLEISETILKEVQEFLSVDHLYSYERTETEEDQQSNTNESILKRGSRGSRISRKTDFTNLMSKVMKNQQQITEKEIQEMVIKYQNLVRDVVPYSQSAKVLRQITYKFTDNVMKKKTLECCWMEYFSFYKKASEMYNSSKNFKFHSLDKRFQLHGYKIQESFHKHLNDEIMNLQNCLMENADLNDENMVKLFTLLAQYESKYRLIEKIQSSNSFVEYYYILSQNAKLSDQKEIEEQFYQKQYKNRKSELEKKEQEIIKNNMQRFEKKAEQKQIEKMNDLNFETNHLKQSKIYTEIENLRHHIETHKQILIFEEVNYLFDSIQKLNDGADIEEINKKGQKIKLIYYERKTIEEIKELLLKLQQKIKRITGDDMKPIQLSIKKIFADLNEMDVDQDIVIEKQLQNNSEREIINEQQMMRENIDYIDDKSSDILIKMEKDDNLSDLKIKEKEISRQNSGYNEEDDSAERLINKEKDDQQFLQNNYEEESQIYDISIEEDLEFDSEESIENNFLDLPNTELGSALNRIVLRIMDNPQFFDNEELVKNLKNLKESLQFKEFVIKKKLQKIIEYQTLPIVEFLDNVQKTETKDVEEDILLIRNIIQSKKSDIIQEVVEQIQSEKEISPQNSYQELSEDIQERSLEDDNFDQFKEILKDIDEINNHIPVIEVQMELKKIIDLVIIDREELKHEEIMLLEDELEKLKILLSLSSSYETDDFIVFELEWTQQEVIENMFGNEELQKISKGYKSILEFVHRLNKFKNFTNQIRIVELKEEKDIKEDQLLSLYPRSKFLPLKKQIYELLYNNPSLRNNLKTRGSLSKLIELFDEIVEDSQISSEKLELKPFILNEFKEYLNDLDEESIINDMSDGQKEKYYEFVYLVDDVFQQIECDLNCYEQFLDYETEHNISQTEDEPEQELEEEIFLIVEYLNCKDCFDDDYIQIVK